MRDRLQMRNIFNRFDVAPHHIRARQPLLVLVIPGTPRVHDVIAILYLWFEFHPAQTFVDTVLKIEEGFLHITIACGMHNLEVSLVKDGDTRTQKPETVSKPT